MKTTMAMVLIVLAVAAALAATPCDSTEDCENAAELYCEQVEHENMTVSMLVFDQGTPECWFCCESYCATWHCFGPAITDCTNEHLGECEAW